MKCWIALFAVIVSIQCINVRAESTKIYVGNLSYFTTEKALRAGFETYGQVLSATVIRDKDTDRSRGFGFVTMSTDKEADKAIEGLNGSEFDGRVIRVNRSN